LKRTIAFALLSLVLTAGAAPAGGDVDFGANVQVGDDSNLFFSISSRYFGRDQRDVEDWGRRYYPDPDDLAVALFLSRHCDNGPEFAFNLRQQGMGWFEISNRCRVPVEVYFLPIDRDPGPPYGRAYGHWKKYRHDHKYVMVLDDADIRNLVAVRMAHEYYGVPIDVAMRWRSSGRDIRSLMAGEYRERHAKKHGGDDRGKGHGGNDKGTHGKGGHGKDDGHRR
jgi:hypothetical protein